MTICIFGGTFDPPHIGHVHACAEFLANYDVDKLYVIPTFIPPHKTRSSTVSADDRFEMCKIAFLPLSDKIEISDVEIKREGRSYTAHTISYFKDLGCDKIYFLCGTDMFLTLDKWYDFKYIFSNAVIACMRRESEAETEKLIESKMKEYITKYNAKICFVNSDAITLSSSEIRDDFDGMNSRGYIPDSVYEYVKRKNLYGEE